MKPRTLFAVFFATSVEDLEKQMNSFATKSDGLTIIAMNTNIAVHPINMGITYITTIAYKIYTT